MSYLFFPSPTPVFPELKPLTWSLIKKPIMASRVAIAATGREVQVAQASYPRFAFKLSYGNQSWLRERTQNIVPWAPLNAFTEFETLTGLWLLCQGPYGEFYYKDPDDYSRGRTLIAIADGLTHNFPISFTWGSGPFVPPMMIPVGGIISVQGVWLNGTGFPPSSGFWSIDSTNTQLVVSLIGGLPPPAGWTIEIAFNFYWRCRFLDDTVSFSQWAKNLWENKEINFESVKP